MTRSRQNERIIKSCGMAKLGFDFIYYGSQVCALAMGIAVLKHPSTSLFYLTISKVEVVDVPVLSHRLDLMALGRDISSLNFIYEINRVLSN